MNSSTAENDVCIRRASPEDALLGGQICYEAFAAINEQHRFPPDIPSAEVSTGFLQMLFAHPGFYCVVAEINGELVGSNCLDERSAIAGVGPLTIKPGAQNRSIGRKLMRAVIDRPSSLLSPAYGWSRRHFITGRSRYIRNSDSTPASPYRSCRGLLSKRCETVGRYGRRPRQI